MSLALRDSPRVAGATKALVMEYAKSVNYIPNPNLARLLSQVRTNPDKVSHQTIVYLTSYTPEHRFHPVFNLYLDGAREEARRLGYAFEHIDLIRDGFSSKRLQEILVARGIEGVLLAPGYREIGFPEIDISRFCCLALGFSFPHIKVNRIAFDHFRSTFRALEELHRRGYRRIGFVFPDEYRERFQYRWDGAYHSFMCLRKDQQAVPMMTRATDPSGVIKWLSRYKPDVVVEGAPVCLPMLLNEGYQIGRDLGYLSLTLDAVTLEAAAVSQRAISNFPYNLTGTRENCKYTAERAIRWIAGELYSRKDFNVHRPELILIEGEWVEGETIRPSPFPDEETG